MHLTKGRSAVPERGFSLVELIVVVSIICIVAGVMVPQILTYMRNYEIQAAAQEVASSIQTARMKAVAKNVNLGVMFEVRDDRNYGWVVEDDLDTVTVPNWTTVADEADLFLPAGGQSPTLLSLPTAVVFDPPDECQAIGAADRYGLRFNRLGSACAIGATGCAVPGGAAAPDPFINSAAAGFNICLRHTRTGLRRLLTISQSGRVTSRPIGGA